MPRTLIFANGSLPDPEFARSLIREDDILVAADGGTRHILAIGFAPHYIVGDLDSLPVDVHDPAIKDAQVMLYPRDKNETDLELAISHALSLNSRQIVVVSALGGRLDQTLGNISLLADPRLSLLDCRFDDGAEEIFFCRDRATVKGSSGELVSLIPWGGEVSGVITENLKWPLRDETLHWHATRGISNQMLADEAFVNIRSGLLLIVHTRAGQ